LADPLVAAVAGNEDRIRSRCGDEVAGIMGHNS
jgi:hypothetical protein